MGKASRCVFLEITMAAIFDWRQWYFEPAPDMQQLLQLSGNSSGYVREEAVRRLASLGDSSVLPALIERVNDWVAPVRGIARHAVLQFATSENVATFVQCLPQFKHLLSLGRDDHRRFVGQIETFLREEGRTYVLAGIDSPHSAVARACMKFAIEHRLADDEALARIALSHADALISLNATALLSAPDGRLRPDLLAIALTNRFLPTRRTALRLMLRGEIEAGRVEPFLFDKHRSIRAIAARHLAALGFDVAGCFREALDHAVGHKLRIALWGVGEYGDAQDIGLLRERLVHPSAAIRRDALVAYSRRLGMDAQAQVLAALSDSVQSVADEAARIARRIKAQFTAAQLLSLLQPSRPADDFARLIVAQRFADKWERLTFLLQVYAHRPDLRSEIPTLLNQWNQHGNSLVWASAEQIARLQQLVDDDASIAAVVRGNTTEQALKLIDIRLRPAAEIMTQPDDR
ncbi:HEAT repeat domain-containing protein [Tahibacter aquaticus]|nr:hypothetical protein [Tahibacter aquaticus]